MVESILRGFLEHPSRRWIVIILTLAFALVVVWPTADEYFAQKARHDGLQDTLAETRASVERKSFYEKQLQKNRELLASFETRSLPEASMFEFRGSVAEFARNSGCQVQTMRLGKSNLRRWHEKDDPLSIKKSGGGGKATPFELRSQEFSLSVSGSVSAIKSFLNQMKQADKLSHTNSLAVRPESNNPQFAELDLELLLFDLQPASNSDR